MASRRHAQTRMTEVLGSASSQPPFWTYKRDVYRNALVVSPPSSHLLSLSLTLSPWRVPVSLPLFILSHFPSLLSRFSGFLIICLGLCLSYVIPCGSAWDLVPGVLCLRRLMTGSALSMTSPSACVLCHDGWGKGQEASSLDRMLL